MTVLFYLLAAAVIFQRIFEIRSYRKTQGTIHAAWTLKAMSAVHAFCLLGAPLEWTLRGRPADALVLGAGVVLFALGTYLRFWVQRTLREFWSVQIEIREDHRLCTDGPYTLCRHPNYLGILLEVGGYALFFQAWVTLALTCTVYYLVLRKRIDEEEKVMVDKFGEAYVRMQKNLPRMFPFRTLKS